MSTFSKAVEVFYLGDYREAVKNLSPSKKDFIIIDSIKEDVTKTKKVIRDLSKDTFSYCINMILNALAKDRSYVPGTISIFMEIGSSVKFMEFSLDEQYGDELSVTIWSEGRCKGFTKCVTKMANILINRGLTMEPAEEHQGLIEVVFTGFKDNIGRNGKSRGKIMQEKERLKG